jgi:hypothetical protein
MGQERGRDSFQMTRVPCSARLACQSSSPSRRARWCRAPFTTKWLHTPAQRSRSAASTPWKAGALTRLIQNDSRPRAAFPYFGAQAHPLPRAIRESGTLMDLINANTRRSDRPVTAHMPLVRNRSCCSTISRDECELVFLEAVPACAAWTAPSFVGRFSKPPRLYGRATTPITIHSDFVGCLKRMESQLP